MNRQITISILLLLTTLLTKGQEVAKNNNPKLIARIIVDSEVFTSQRDTSVNDLKFTDVRIGVKGAIDNVWFYKLDIGFADNKVSGKDIFFGYQKGVNKVQVGQFYEPYSLGYLASTTDMEFQQVPSSVFAFGGSRKLGLSYTYDVEKVNYTFSAFTDKSVNDYDNSLSTYSFNSRLIYRPIYEGSRIVHLAVAPSWKRFGKSTEYYSPGFSAINILKLASVMFDDPNSQFRVGLEAYAQLNRLFLKGEYVTTTVYSHDNNPFRGDGGYLEVSYVPIGELFSYDSSWGCLGKPSGRSLEVVARYNYLDLNDSSADVYGGSHHDFSVGVNYYITKNIALKCSYNHLMPLDNISFLGDDAISSMQFRLQIVI